MKLNQILKQSMIATAIAVANTSFAQDATLEETVVWGTKINSSSVLLGDDQIAIKQSDHLSDLLRDIPGVNVGGAHSINQRINVRGLDDTDMEVTLDGARQNNYMYHHAGNLLVNTDILKQVDIQVGANSIINNELGGAVAFETKDAKDMLASDETVGGRIQAGYNSNASTSYGITGYSQLTESLDVLGYFNTVDRDNYENGEGVETRGSDSDNENYLVKFGLDVADNQRIELSYDDLNEEGEYAWRPDMNGEVNDAFQGGLLYPTTYERSTITLGYELDLGDSLSLRATLYDNEMYMTRDEDLETASGFNEGWGENTGLAVLAKSVIDSGNLQQNLTYGLEANTETGKNSLDGLTRVEEEADSYALYIQDQIKVGEKLTLTPGLRYDSYKIDAPKNKETYNETSGAFAIGYELSGGFTLNLGYTQTFKGPELSEIFNAQGETVENNPDLVPEDGDNIEYGFAYQKSDFLGADAFTARLSIFRTDVNNYIEETDYPLDTCEGRGCAVWEENVGTVEIDGFEASANYTLGNFNALVAYADSESDINGTGEPLEREIGDSISATFEYMVPQWDLALNWNAQFIREQAAYEPTEILAKPSYKLHNISARWTPGNSLEGVSLTFGVDNLFDEYYVSHASRNGEGRGVVIDDYEPGRNVKLTASYSF